jgi:glycosyltransferase involved in cell wall biosynthesis
MHSKKTPFFSIVIPLFNKEKHVLGTIYSVLSQTIQDFEIIVVNDGSTDSSSDVVNSVNDPRVKLIEQCNAGVSTARNRGVEESSAKYIVFVDADDRWLPDFLYNICELISKFPNCGMYATAYRIRNTDGEEKSINIQGVRSDKKYTVIPSYFKSVAYGDNLVWSSAVCIPKEVFTTNNIRFPVGEAYGEDQYVWARVATQYEVAYCQAESAIYDRDVENNTMNAIQEQLDPYKSLYMLRGLRPMLSGKEALRDFDEYISKMFHRFPLRNIKYRSKLYGLKQVFSLELKAKHKLKLFLMFFVPRKILFSVIKLKRISPKNR